MVKATRLRADQRRGTIITAARTLFAERGYGNTHVTDIAAAAGCTTGPLYHFFANKRDVFHTALRACIRDAALSMTHMRATEDHSSPLDRLIESCDHLLSLLTDNEMATFTREAPHVLEVDDYRHTLEEPLLAFIATDLGDAMADAEIRPQPLQPLAVLITGAILGAANHSSTDPEHLDDYRSTLTGLLEQLRIN
jgi:AcrR family transcriptional regulator